MGKSKGQRLRRANKKRNEYRNAITQGEPSKVFKSPWGKWVATHNREVIGTRATEEEAQMILAEKLLEEQLNRLLD